ncbi:hypothetical protein NE236_00175 [Actinoallomurus purpureus]|uniref:hypothetical protein n=1 Tax=Actinoallomurus purpureus TaxID=478114 RepID=UPI0020926EB3|nr:hypothetical protein [Actinoallomurus purpureus]MCO6003393.1 hypothetical protein [Actinoallomurus purpureus]
MSDLEPACFLCRAAAGATDIPWTDRPLWLDPRYGVLVPGLGGLSAGYVLLAPVDHHHNLASASLDTGGGADGFTDFVHALLTYLRAKMGSLTYWEHGGGYRPGVRSSACVEHAHLHIVPGTLDLPLPPGHRSYPSIGRALAALVGRSEVKDGYLLMGHSPGHCFVGRDVGISQYYRREWARLLGRADEWDYLLSEDPELTRKTIAAFFDRQI